MIRVLMFLALATPAQSATHGFCWRGENGYRMEGFLSYPDAMRGRVVTERDVTGFGITGWKDDAYLGRWSLKQRGPGTSWVLRFDTRTLSFPMGGLPQEGSYQAWNANGIVTDCGDPGFGFNGGNAAQDVCVDGEFRRDSSIAPDTPLAIAPDPSDPCGPVPISSLTAPRRHG